MTMRVHATGPQWALIQGDVEHVCPELPQGYFDAVLCDPPYGLSFMAKGWDYQVPSIALWRAVLGCLKPGAPILAFGGTRTYHRLVVNLEDAGAEIRDQLAWLYGSGFPKSQDASKAIDAAAGAERLIVGERSKKQSFGANEVYGGGPDKGGVQLLTEPATEAAALWQGYGTALKPAQEPIVLARKPLSGTLAANIAAHGCGPLAIDACRLDSAASSFEDKRQVKTNDVYGTFRPVEVDGSKGRWPANVLLDEEAAAVLDAQSGTTHTHGGKVTKNHAGMGYAGGLGSEREVLASSGGASRFFYTAKASRSEREAGLDAFPVLSGGEMTDREDGSAALNSPRTGAGRGGGRRNPHPTVKPIAVMRYLARLVRPAGPTRRILVPFAGVGSEMIAACLEGFDEVIGIELGEEHPEYLDIAAARLAHWTAPGKRV